MPIEEILVRRLLGGFSLRVEPVRSGQLWRCLISEGGGDRWTSVRPAHPGFATPTLAVEDADARIAELVAGRVEATAVEVTAALNAAIKERRLDRVIVDEDEMWVVRFDGGTTDPASTPSDAARLALSTRQTQPRTR